jgi:MinD-like ATPase involved in chromosome partitioning or flagellar assembly
MTVVKEEGRQPPGPASRAPRDEVVPLDWLPLGERRPSPSADLSGREPEGARRVMPVAFEGLVGVRRPALGGWRGMIARLSGGRVTPSPSRRERWRIEQARQARTPIQGRCALVAVLSRKGGVGKSTVTALLTSTFGLLRGDAVVALDAATEVGNLADRLVVEGVRLTTHDLARAGEVDGRADISRYTVCDPQARLEVVAAPLEGDTILSRGEAERLWGVLARTHNLVLADVGATLAEPATALVVEWAEQAVVVTTPAADAVRLAGRTLDHLERVRGRAFVVERSCVVVNATPDARSAEQVGRVFAERGVAWLPVRFDRHLAQGGRFDWALIAPGVADDYLALAGLVGARFRLEGTA